MQTESKPVWVSFPRCNGIDSLSWRRWIITKFQNLPSQLFLKYPTPPPNLLRKMRVITERTRLCHLPVSVATWRRPRSLGWMMPLCTSVASCCILCGIRGDLTPAVLTARMWSRSCCHVVPDALSRWRATVGGCGSLTCRHLRVTEGLHFQTILRTRRHHWDHREGAAAEGAVRFGETPTRYKPKGTILSGGSNN